MNGPLMLLEELSASGVLLTRHGDRLVLDGPEMVITDSLIEKVRMLKADILSSLEDWSAEDWQVFFDERAAIAEFKSRLPRADAEAQAFECCIVEWLNRHPEPSDPGLCAWCKEPDRSGHMVVPLGTESNGDTWLHPQCWDMWYRNRRERAVQALARQEINAPMTAYSRR